MYAIYQSQNAALFHAAIFSSTVTAAMLQNTIIYRFLSGRSLLRLFSSVKLILPKFPLPSIRTTLLLQQHLSLYTQATNHLQSVTATVLSTYACVSACLASPSIRAKRHGTWTMAFSLNQIIPRTYTRHIPPK